MADQVVSILVLVVDDEAMILHIVEDALTEGGYAVEVANGPEQAIEMLNKKTFQI